MKYFYSQKSPNFDSVSSNSTAPLVQCTSHMCPIQVHWHLKLNDKDNWRVNVMVTNLNFRMNYTQWNMVVQHPNFDNLTRIFSFNYKLLEPFADISKHSVIHSFAQCITFISRSFWNCN